MKVAVTCPCLLPEPILMAVHLLRAQWSQRERAGTLSGVTAALRALWVLPIHRAHIGHQLCFLVAR